jgi:hypothetical protein
MTERLGRYPAPIAMRRSQIGRQRLNRTRVAQLPQRFYDRRRGNWHIPAAFERLNERFDDPWVKFSGLQDVPRRVHPHKLISIFQDTAQRLVEDGLLAIHAQPVQGHLPAMIVRILKNHIPQSQHHPPTSLLLEELAKHQSRLTPHLRSISVE